MKQEPSSYVFVDTPTALHQVLREVEPMRRLGIDTEANGLYRYHQRVCLMQLTTDERTTFIVDPLAQVDLNPLLDLLRSRELIFHAADYDLRMMRATFGFEPKAPVWDTMIAAQLLGVEELGLVTVANRYLGIELTKHGQKSDWTRRPLSETQLAYAGDDTRYLGRLADTLSKELARLGRDSWHAESCAKMVQATASNNSTERDPWRIKGSGLLPSDELVFLKFIWEWRETEASEADVPPFKVIGNASLFEISKWAAANRNKRLDDIPRLPRSIRGSRHRRLLSALRQARGVPKRDWPQPPPRGERPPSTPGFKRRVAYLHAASVKIARRLGLPASVIAPRSAIVEIARLDSLSVDALVAETPLMRWQAELLVPEAVDGYHAIVRESAAVEEA